jgi:hypothetical protein
LLFTASILLLVTTISAPIWNHVGLLRVHLNNGTLAHHNSTISFGTFGHCILCPSAYGIRSAEPRIPLWLPIAPNVQLFRVDFEARSPNDRQIMVHSRQAANIKRTETHQTGAPLATSATYSRTSSPQPTAPGSPTLKPEAPTASPEP